MAKRNEIDPFDQTEIRIKGVPGSTKIQLRNIADKIGVDVSPFLKQKLDEIVQSYPDHYRNYSPPPDSDSD